MFSDLHKSAIQAHGVQTDHDREGGGVASSVYFIELFSEKKPSKTSFSETVRSIANIFSM